MVVRSLVVLSDLLALVLSIVGLALGWMILFIAHSNMICIILTWS